ncbi:HD domain-containing phosphohydrolase [Serpentinicella alkaliphila]|uniref:HD domain-containing protein n=1 Tax=Serpentinicella alkaliphila TaxID=1734049 RepID=A0A4R2U2K2_9FIRM|nr:HD domain-containing phosphohydrolase [Serpentinicella alkaliphila]QUH26812.1 HD domain-containing protein [Serpentinicella alkaliphila]TCQ08035.1 HD domain-containing protein [Serpentinicella alkaliphila]
MKSIRRLVALIVTAIICVLTIALLINNYYLRPILIQWVDMNKELLGFSETYIEADLNIRVMDNVVSQVTSTQIIEPGRLIRIKDAHNENYQNLVLKFDQLISINQSINGTLTSLEGYSLLSFFINYDNFVNLFKNLAEKTEAINNSILDLSDISITDQKLSIVELHKEYKELRAPLSDVRLKYGELTGQVIPKFINILNITLIVLFVIVTVLASLLNKVAGRVLRYIFDSFKILNSNNYNVNNIPRLKSTFEEEKLIGEFVDDIFNERLFINKIKEIVSTEYIIDNIIEKLLVLVKDILNTDRIGVAFVDYKKQSIIAEHGAFNYGKVLLGPGFEVEFHKTGLTKLIDTKKPIITMSIQNELAKRPESESLKLLNQEGIKSNMIIPLIINNVVLGFLFFSSVEENNYNSKSVQFGVKISTEISNILDKTYLTKKMFSTATRTFANLVEKRDNETGNHILRMTQYSRIIAEELINHLDSNYRVNESFVSDIINYASIHDIGKIGIPDEVLKKPGRLTNEERTIMQTHSTIGASILTDLEQSLKIFNRDFYRTAIDIAHFHHERWDGKGYPEGLSGLHIPLAARIVSIADVFDALTSRRVYKDSIGFEESVKIINEGSGTQFDPQLVRVFNNALQKFKDVYESDIFTNKDYYYEKQFRLSNNKAYT